MLDLRKGDKYRFWRVVLTCDVLKPEHVIFSSTPALCALKEPRTIWALVCGAPRKHARGSLSGRLIAQSQIKRVQAQVSP